MTILGIDLGTTFSAVAAVYDSKPFILPVGTERIMPSVVGISPEGRWTVGRPALNQYVLHPESTILSIKRQMGSNTTVLLGGQGYNPAQISAIILQALRAAAATQLNQEVQQAVITVPAFFSDAQRQATHEAGLLAGLDVVRIINEPTAAALAYGMQHDRDEIALVYDLGGGTFDVSLVEFSAGVVDVRASHGNTQLGGDDFDERLAEWIVTQFEDQHDVDLRGNRSALIRIRRAAEQAKRTLSSSAYAWVKEEYLTQKNGVALHLEMEISRTQFMELINDLLRQTLDSVDRVLRDGQVQTPDQVLLVGGSTYIPEVWEMLANHLGIAPRQDINPSEAVALGAAIQGAIIAGEPIDAILVDVTPFSLGINVVEFSLLGHVIPDRLKVLIPRNTTIPTNRQEVFTPLYLGQNSVKIEVYQGESPIASDNTLLGEFLFENLRPEEQGALPKFTVQFDIDLNGMLQVKVMDRGSQQTNGITVQANHQRLSQKDIVSLGEALPIPTQSSDLPETLIHEMEVLLARAQILLTQQDIPDISADVDTVYAAWEHFDANALRNALDNLTDTLFDWEEQDD